ncbi:MAG: sugar phosphate isomerase/epimerase [Ardenticatenaceae bacterium]|nr:sugar phosphate isomerase/epimerase [Ardenticatenaceae bacterium]
MKIGMVTDSLGHLSLDELLETAVNLGIQTLEFGCGGWSSAPHLKLDLLLESESERNNFMAKIRDHGLEISALNCSGNQLAPGALGQDNDQVVRKTFKLAKLMGIRRIVMMSGLPGASPEAKHANWYITAWPPEVHEGLRYQWEDVAIPYWRELVQEARNNGIEKLCVEQHASQLVYNTATLLRLREAVGEMVGVNFDPSHALWMGGDPLRAIPYLRGAIYHVHAKDTRVDPHLSEINTRLETKNNERVAERSWNYVTLGYGHDERWWRDFVVLLRQNGYDDVLSIEHEDFNLPPLVGVEKSVDLLRNVM